MLCDRDAPARRAHSVNDIEWRPFGREAGFEVEPAPRAAQSEQRFEGQAQHPSRRAGVPRPAAASGVRRNGVDIRADHVRLDLVSRGALSVARVADRLNHSPQLPRTFVVALCGEGHDRPDRGMRVLASVLAHARYVAADVTGIRFRRVERRIEQLHEPLIAPHEPRIQCFHALTCAFGGADARQHRPALRDRVDLALGILGGAERRAVVEVRAAPPGAVPAVLLDVAREALALASAAFGERRIAARLRERFELTQYFAQEKAEPHALAAALQADHVHAVVPIAAADQRQSVCAEAQSMLDRADRMLIERRGLHRDRRQIELRFLAGRHRRTFDEGHELIEHAHIARPFDVAARRERQPQVVIGAARAHAASARWVPPMLHVSLDELARGAAQQMFAQQFRLGVQQRHCILKLVAKSIGAARLVVAAPRPIAACERLIDEPTIDEHVERRLGRMHLHGAQCPRPVFVDRVERIVDGVRHGEAAQQLARFIHVLAGPESKHDLALIAVVDFERHLDRSARVEPRADFARQAAAPKRRGIAKAAMATEKLRAIGRDGALRLGAVEECNAFAELGVIAIAREDRTAVAIDLGHDVHRRMGALLAEHPFDIADRGQSA